MNEALQKAIDDIVSRIPDLKSDRQYWFIRTNGGLFYQDFLDTASVGIGYNLVTWAQIKKALTKGKDAEGGIVAAILNRYSDFDKNKLGRVAGLFTRFYTEMKPGDVVVMPSPGSVEYAFGIVADGEPTEVDTTTTDDKLIYRKRRPVEWIARKAWQKMDSNLYEAFRAPQAMTTLNPFATYLDREMHSLYTKNGLTHVRIDINTTKEISATDYFSMGSALIGLCNWYSQQLGLTFDESEIDIRQNIQSPGRFELIAKKMAVGAFIASAIGVALFGGKASLKDFKDVEFNTEGAGHLLLEAYKEHNRQENMQRVLDATLPKMNAEQGADMMRILNGQAPVPSSARTATATDTAATAASSDAAATDATASLVQSDQPQNPTDSTAVAAVATPPKRDDK